MEEKKRNELTDEQLDEVSGGGGSRQYVKAYETVPVFALPGLSSKIVGELQMGQTAEYLGQEGGWYHIYDVFSYFVQGWVQSRHVSIIND